MGRLLFVGLVLGTWTINIANCGLLTEPTQRHSVGYNDQPPAPTQSIEALELGLAERQPTKFIEYTFTMTMAGDSTCGFLSGSPGNAITCENRLPCFWEQEYMAAIFCGTNTNAEFHTTCVERETALNPELCNDPQGSSMTSNSSVTIPATSITTTTSPPKSKDDRSPNIAAIVGATIAGFGVLALLALGTFWLLRRFKTRMPPPVCTELPG
ncbi:hypothetical protein H9L39_00002 [Fusarium oxysporum f. sp. albedinis]|nr:hypothetical protein H9L39_00002 [Fusarium oxysporum f. sp. albedinis]